MRKTIESQQLPAHTCGFTLIELLLYVSILGALLAAVSVFFGVTAQARAKSEVIGTVNDQAQYAMDYITTTLRGGTAVTSLSNGATSSSLTLTVPTSANSPTIFTLNSGVLTVKKGAAAAVPLTSGSVAVSNLSFASLSRAGTNGVIQVSFTITANNPTGRSEYGYAKTFTSAAEVSW